MICVLLSGCGLIKSIENESSSEKNYTPLNNQDTSNNNDIDDEVNNNSSKDINKNETSINSNPFGQSLEDSQEADDVSTSSVNSTLNSLIKEDGVTIKERFLVPEGYTRVEPEVDSFMYYLQNLPLKTHGSKVKYYDGREKLKDVYLAVVDFTLGNRDLQQCADGVMRLRAEYLYAMGRFDEIHFNFVSGFKAEFSKWAAGNGISVNGNSVAWIRNQNNNNSYESFQKYLDIVYAYASTLSLEKELVEREVSDINIGDVFIQGGSPGHCVIVVDMAKKETTGETLVMLAQSYMPAQDIQILRGDDWDSPWFSMNLDETLSTPEWTFDITDLKTWE